MDTPAAPDPNLSARIAVLEEIAAATKAGLADIRAELRSMRAETSAGFDAERIETLGIRSEIRDELREMRIETASGFDTLRSEARAMRNDLGSEMREIRAAQRSDFRWLLGIMLGGLIALLGGLGGAMAHGFHWL